MQSDSQSWSFGSQTCMFLLLDNIYMTETDSSCKISIPFPYHWTELGSLERVVGIWEMVLKGIDLGRVSASLGQFWAGLGQ